TRHEADGLQVCRAAVAEQPQIPELVPLRTGRALNLSMNVQAIVGKFGHPTPRRRCRGFDGDFLLARRIHSFRWLRYGRLTLRGEIDARYFDLRSFWQRFERLGETDRLRCLDGRVRWLRLSAGPN